MKRSVVCLGLVLALATCGAGAVAPPSFAAVMPGFVDDFARENPVSADALGIQSGADRLEDVSAAGHDRGIASLSAWRARFAATAQPGDGADVRADRTAMLDALDAQLIEDRL